MTKKQALLKVLKDAQLLSENGDSIIDFETRGRDRADFASVSRATLLRMLEAAYTAGMEADVPN